MLDVVKRSAPAIPFDADRLDRLMDEAGIDVLLATSKHNVQYLLGGHRAFFFEYMDAMGLSRYLPVLVYPKGAAAEGGLFRPPDGGLPEGERSRSGSRKSQTNSSAGRSTPWRRRSTTSVNRGCKTAGSAPSSPFLPVDAGTALRKAFPGSEIVDAVFVLERLRAMKSPAELEEAAHRVRSA